MKEDFSWDPERGGFVSRTVDPETGVTTERIKIVEGNALREIRTDLWGELERQIWTDGKGTEWKLSDKGERPGFFKQVSVDDEKKIVVELAIDRTGPEQAAVNYDECGKLAGTEANGWRASSLDGNRQKLLGREVGWGEFLRFAGYEYCIEKTVGGRIRVRIGKNPGFTEVLFREQIANEQIFNLLGSDKPEDWKRVFELV